MNIDSYNMKKYIYIYVNNNNKWQIVRQFVRSLAASLAHSLARPLASFRSFVRSFTCSYVRSFIRWLHCALVSALLCCVVAVAAFADALAARQRSEYTENCTHSWRCSRFEAAESTFRRRPPCAKQANLTERAPLAPLPQCRAVTHELLQHSFFYTAATAFATQKLTLQTASYGTFSATESVQAYGGNSQLATPTN